MTKDDIIRMAREACDTDKVDAWHNDFWTLTQEELERFAALVIKPWADQLEVERKRFQELNDLAALGMQDARAAEREACAKVAEEWQTEVDDPRYQKSCADAIRARGQQ